MMCRNLWKKAVINSDRVLMICTDRYVDKANEGLGGVGYEATIVTGELVKNLGTGKFIPVIRQGGPEYVTPTSVSTRKYVDLSDRNGEWEAAFDELVRDLHNVPPQKPPLRKRQSAAVVALTPENVVMPDDRSADRAADPGWVFRQALDAAKTADMLRWRRLIAASRATIRPALDQWWIKYGGSHPGPVPTLVEQSMEGAASFAPLAAIALAGIASENERYENQVGLIDDILNPSEWHRNGLVIRVELPETGAFIYQALSGAMCLNMQNIDVAMRLARESIPSRTDGGRKQMWLHHNIVMWPQALGHNAAAAWDVLTSLPERWPWVGDVFGDRSDYQAALYAYYVCLNVLEYMEVLARGGEFPNGPNAAWPAHVPPAFERTPEVEKRRGYRLLISAAPQLKAFWLSLGVDQQLILRYWQQWMAIQNYWRNEWPGVGGAAYFESLIPEVFAVGR
jgi:hypothetical protein